MCRQKAVCRATVQDVHAGDGPFDYSRICLAQMSKQPEETPFTPSALQNFPVVTPCVNKKLCVVCQARAGHTASDPRELPLPARLEYKSPSNSFCAKFIAANPLSGQEESELAEYYGVERAHLFEVMTFHGELVLYCCRGVASSVSHKNEANAVI